MSLTVDFCCILRPFCEHSPTRKSNMADAAFKPPSFVANDVNACLAWRDFKEDMKNYLVAAGLKEASGERKVAILLYGLGSRYRRVFDNFIFAENEKKDSYDDVTKKFDTHFEPKQVIKLYMRKFDSCVQKSGETVSEYVSNLRDIAKYCNFGDTLEAQLCKQISSGVRSPSLRDKLWSEDLTLAQIIAKCHLFEQRQDSLHAIEGKSNDVHYANTGRGRNNYYRGYRGRSSRGRGRGSGSPAQGQTRGTPPPRNDRGRGRPRGRGYSVQNGPKCLNCGYSHRQGQQCPAYGKQCRFCKIMNHFESVCQRKKRVHMTESHDVDNENNYVYQAHSGSENTNADLFVYMGSVTASACNTSAPNEKLMSNVNEKLVSNVNEKHVSTISKLNHIKWIVNLELCNPMNDKQSLPFKIDTGADCSCISLDTYTKCIKRGLVNSHTLIAGISAPAVQPAGKVDIEIFYKGKKYNLTCEVIDQNIPNLIGLNDSLMLNLIRRVDHVDKLLTNVACKYPESKAILSEFNDVFQGVGKIPGEISLKIDTNAIPVAHPPRPIPVALRNAVKDKLDQLENEGIIVKIAPGIPTRWCAPMHTVLKRSKPGKPITKDDIRITIDPRDLNQALLREYHPINTIDQVITKTHGSKLFTKLDARQGFFQLVLDNESSLLTSFTSPFGRYCHKRLPMGVSVAPEIYQRAMQELFGEIEGCEIIFDDLLLHAPDLKSHNELLRRVLQRARDNNVVFNKEKLYLCQQQVEYVGHVLSSEGVKVSPDKVAAVLNMSQPESVSNIQTLLGMVTYTCKFIKNLSSLTEPLRQLMIEGGKPGFTWHWDPYHQKAFEDVKTAMTTTPVLGYYTLGKPITMSVDASQSGLGAVLFQDGKPIHYASKALSPSEYNYAQIEKELLAIVWGYNKFHTYLYGRSDVTVETDHKPLVALKDKPLFQMPPRLQKMFMKIRHNNFKLIHKPGKDIPVPDCMSRLYGKEELKTEDVPALQAFMAKCLSTVYQEDCDGDEFEHIFTIATEDIRSTYSFSSKRLLEVREETKYDTTLQRLISLLGAPKLPDNRSSLSPEIRPYFAFLDELSVVDGIVFKGDRVVIPDSMRRELLGILHESHLGMVKCKQLARDVLYWPGLNKQIEDMVSRCAACQHNRTTQQKEPLSPTEIPQRPWQIVATDLFDWDDSKYLIMVDYFSEWFEIEQLRVDSTASTVIGKTSKWFATHGIPEKVISDNGPPFQSYSYKDFAEKYGFFHQTISPYHSQSNGLVEKFVGVAKGILTKCKEMKQDPYLALLNHRNTPRDGVGSPAQRLFGRRTCTRLPTADTLLKPNLKDSHDVTDRLMKDRLKAKSYYDRGAKPLPDLYAGDTVRVRSQQGTWEPAQLMGEHPYRSHSVMMPNGRIRRRNRRDIRKTREDGSIFQRQCTLDDVDVDLETVPRRENAQIPVNVPTPAAQSSPTNPHVSINTPKTPAKPPDLSRHGRIRKPNPKYDPQVYDLGK